MRGHRLLSGDVLVGLVLIALGVLALLDRLEIADLSDVVSTWWPMVLIIPGAIALVQGRGRGFGAYLLLFFGIGFLLERLDVIADDWLSAAWPLILILVGLSIMLPRIIGGPRTESIQSADDEISAFALMSGTVWRTTSDRFRGGEVTAIMGGAELDLSQATPVAEGATLRAFALMGGVEIRVPDTWVVEIGGVPLLGGIEDSRRARAAEGDSPPRLKVVATAVMGGVEIASPRTVPSQ